MQVSGHLHTTQEWKSDHKLPVAKQYDNNNDQWFEDRLVHRATCRVLIGKYQNALPWLEQSLNKFAVSKSVTNHGLTGNSILIVDSASVSVLKSHASGNSTLYDRLIENNVKLVPVQEVMNFLVNKYNQNPIPELVSNLNKLPLTKRRLSQKQADSNVLDFFRANLLKLLCADYTFSLDERVSQVAVVDADSLMPLHPRRSAQTTRSAAPMSLEARLVGLTTDDCRFSDLRALADVDFAQKIIKAPRSSKTLSSWLYMFSPHDMFNEFSSRDAARDLTLGVLRVARTLNGRSWMPEDKALAQFKEIKLAPDGYGNYTVPPHIVGESLPELLHNSGDFMNKLFHWHCIPYEPPGSGKCVSYVKLAGDMQGVYIDLKRTFSKVLHRMRVQSLLTSISHLPEKSSFSYCCDPSGQRTDSNFCQNSRPYDQCTKALKEDSSLALVDFSEMIGDLFSYNRQALLFPKALFEKLSPHFNAPMKDWYFIASENNFRLDIPFAFDGQPNSRVFYSFGMEGADRFLKNATSFAITPPTGRIHCSDGWSFWERDFKAGFYSGVAAGGLDELFIYSVPSPNAAISLCARLGRGYLLGGGTGMAISLADHFYNQCIQPLLPEGMFRTCIDTIVTKGILVTTILTGGYINVFGSMAGYTTFNVLYHCFRGLHENAEQEEPGHAHNE